MPWCCWSAWQPGWSAARAKILAAQRDHLRGQPLHLAHPGIEGVAPGLGQGTPRELVAARRGHESTPPPRHRDGTESRAPVAGSRCARRRDPCSAARAPVRQARRAAGSTTPAPSRRRAVGVDGGHRPDQSWPDSSCRAPPPSRPAQGHARSLPPAPALRPHTASPCTPPTRTPYHRHQRSAATRHAGCRDRRA